MITDKHRAKAALRFLNHVVRDNKTNPTFAFPLSVMHDYLKAVMYEAAGSAEAASAVVVPEADAQAAIDKLVEKGLLAHHGPAGWYATTTLTFKDVGPDADPWSGWTLP